MHVMRKFRRLSPFSRVAGALGFLLILASLALSTVSLGTLWSAYPRTPADSSRVQLVSMNLGMLGLAVFTVLISNSMSLRQLARQPVPPASWQSQIRTIMLSAMLPLCALVWAFIVPPSLSVYGFAYGISMLAAWVLLVTLFVLVIRKLAAR
jgi:hypothetical protein